jgi:N-methylhydantoinase A/oxoprolinase/acetone carboxylase beta subunit
MIRLGIDVGGTNTDAVLVDGATVRHSVKTATTPDVSSGIVDVIGKLAALDPHGCGRRPRSSPSSTGQPTSGRS